MIVIPMWSRLEQCDLLPAPIEFWLGNIVPTLGNRCEALIRLRSAELKGRYHCIDGSMVSSLKASEILPNGGSILLAALELSHVTGDRCTKNIFASTDFYISI